MSGVSSQTGFWTKKRVQLLVKGSWLLKPCSHEPEGKTLWVQQYEKWFLATLLVWEVSQKNLLHTFSWTHFSNDASWTCVFDYNSWTPFLGTFLEHVPWSRLMSTCQVILLVLKDLKPAAHQFLQWTWILTFQILPSWLHSNLFISFRPREAQIGSDSLSAVCMVVAKKGLVI